MSLQMDSNLIRALISKVISGECYGLVLSLLRLLTKNFYSMGLLQGVMNIFG